VPDALLYLAGWIRSTSGWPISGSIPRFIATRWPLTRSRELHEQSEPLRAECSGEQAAAAFGSFRRRRRSPHLLQRVHRLADPVLFHEGVRKNRSTTALKVPGSSNGTMGVAFGRMASWLLGMC
jgi:hypothetical protein